MGFFSSIFSAAPAVKDLAGAVAEGADKIWFTDEERQDTMLKFLVAYEPFKRIQRLFGTIILVPYCGLYLLYGLLLMADMVLSGFTLDDEPRKLLLAMLNGDFGTLAILVGSLYFGGGALEGVVERFKKRKS